MKKPLLPRQGLLSVYGCPVVVTPLLLQTLAHYEVGRLRIAVSTLRLLAETLDVNIEELINEQKKQTKNKRGPTPKLQQQIEQIGQMPRSKQKFITEMLDALIQQQQAS